MAFCGKCGNELREGANFCPKCGTPVGSKTGISEKTSNIIEELPQTTDSQTEGKSGNKFWKYAAFVLCLLAFFYIYGKNESSSSDSQDVNTVVEQKQETIVERPSVEQSAPIEEEKPSMQNDEEFKRKTMEYVGEIQQIMTSMNNVYNAYVSSRGSDFMSDSRRVNAQADLSDLRDRGDAIFDKMISLARQKNYQEAIDAFKQEKKGFDDQWYQMSRIFDQDMY